MAAVSVRSVRAPLSAPYSGVPHIGLETGSVESLSGYVVRLAANFAVPASVLAKRAIDSVVPAGSHTVVNTTLGRLNGSGAVVGYLSQGVGLLTGRPELHRLSLRALGQRLRVSDRGLLATTRRWCPAYRRHDGQHPYERKVWWLGVVELFSVQVREVLGLSPSPSTIVSLGADGDSRPSSTESGRLQPWLSEGLGC